MYLREKHQEYDGHKKLEVIPAGIIKFRQKKIYVYMVENQNE